MESKSINCFLENKTVLVTGSTGFLAKVLVEKILNVQPNVKKIYLILRAEDSNSAMKRMHSEIIEKDLFKVLREKWDTSFESLISEKLIPVPGDISYDYLGVKDSNLREEMWNNIDIIVNSAATTNFDERYDISLAINTMGALNILNFAKKCPKLQILLHVSTAYVCGEQVGLVQEKAFKMGDTIKETSCKLNYEYEIQLVEDKLKELKENEVPKEEITIALRDLGMERAQIFGWPNTYSFTKAMGEMCLGHFRENVPIAIIRPTIIASTYKDPFPGWIEGLRTIDTVIAGYCKGKLTSFFANPELIIDLIPADMVVNSIMVAMISHANDQCSNNKITIYHLGSSLRNPIKFSEIHNFIHQYFTKKPLINKKLGIPIIVGKGTVWNSVSTFKIYMMIRFWLPLKMLQLMGIALGGFYQNEYIIGERKFNSALRLVEIYKPYLMFEGIFDDKNAEKLKRKARTSFMDANLFNFDPTSIDWEKFIMNIHTPGLLKYVIRH